MKFRFMIRARPRAEESVEAKHERLRAALTLLRAPKPGAIMAERMPKALDPGKLPLRVVNLDRVFGVGVRASVNYANRKHLPDTGRADDWLSLEFSPAALDYPWAVTALFPGVIEAFGGSYVGSIKDDEFTLRDFDAWRRSGVDYRADVFRIYPVSFFDDVLCRRAFGLSALEVVARTCKFAEVAQMHSGGALIVINTKFVRYEDALQIDPQVRALLRP